MTQAAREWLVQLIPWAFLTIGSATEFRPQWKPLGRPVVHTTPVLHRMNPVLLSQILYRGPCWHREFAVGIPKSTGINQAPYLYSDKHGVKLFEQVFLSEEPLDEFHP